MTSALDERIAILTERLTASDGMLPLGSYRSGKFDLKTFGTAPENLADYFRATSAMHIEAEFLISDEERLTYGQVLDVAEQIAYALISDYSIKPGDRIGIAMRNAPSWVALYMGIILAGGVATLLNGWWQGAELVSGIDDVGCSLVFADEARAKRLSDAGYAGPAQIKSLDISLPVQEALASLFNCPKIALPSQSGDDLATILFTSGSTGKSKGAYSTHRQVVQGTYSFICQALVMLELSIQDGILDPTNRLQTSMLMCIPFFHITGEIPMLLTSFALGRKLILMPKWDVVEAMRLIERERITHFTGVPLMSFEIATHPKRPQFDLSSLLNLAAGGAPRPIDHIRRLTESLPTSPPALGYGLTETNAVGSASFASNYAEKPASAGSATKPIVEIAILNDAGEALAQGQRGEVSIRSVALFSGYWNNPEASAACMTADGFFRTGDIGYLDDDDYLFIVDRKKDIIIRGGENISCPEVEAALYEHPAVAECCVFGLADARLGEVPGAVVHLRAGAMTDEGELKSHVKARLAAFNVPERIWIEPTALPRLGTEKIDKVTLRARFKAEWGK